MYHSRHRKSNEYITVAIDTKSGSLLELINLRTGDNLIKNHRHGMADTFELITSEGKSFTVPKAEAVYSNPDLMAKITEIDNGLEVSYSCLSDGTNSTDISLTYSFRLLEDKINWEISFNNNSSYTITVCKFPYICGVWLGEYYDDDTLVYPFNAGIKVPNPTEYLSMPRNQIGWRWQDYKYTYNIDGMGLWPDKHGVYALSSKYSGPLSMAYCDLYGEDGGFYFASHSSGKGILAIRIEAMGAHSAGINFAVANDIHIKSGEKFAYNKAVTAFHKGDWHDGADIYRKARYSDNDRKAALASDWFLKNPGLFAHYDFKYQNGGIVHSFSDIPALADQAVEVGLNHLLFAGWHHEGFDYGFPMYTADRELGTLDELKSGIDYAHKLGVKVSFYINSRLANTKYTELDELIKDGAAVKAVDANGEYVISAEQYGNLDLKFAAMCAGAKNWQDRLSDAFDYVKEAGAYGIYFDQIAMAPPCVCLNESHGHSPEAWNEGCIKLLELAASKGLSTIIEGCSDLYGTLAAGQLVSTFSYIACAFPELYKYTFPEQILVDMVYPRRGMAMRPTFVGDRWKQLLDTSFICGSYLWAYDLVEDNSFENDPAAFSYLKSIVNARNLWLNKYGHGVFEDDKSLQLTGDISAKLFTSPTMVAFACNSSGMIELDSENKVKELILAVGKESFVKVSGATIYINSPSTGVIIFE